jgi:tRNA G18 (ribose-2'-O)-methylase SpoU
MSKAPDLTGFTKEEIRATLEPVRHPVSIAVCNSDNYFNTGAIIRSAHIFLVREIILVDVPDFYERATMGTHKWENIRHVTTEDFLKEAETRNVICFERRPDLTTKDLMGFQYPENPILCFGSEKSGIPDTLLSRAHSIVSIPQYGLQNDMNLANAMSIGIYDWTVKHYNKKA